MVMGGMLVMRLVRRRIFMWLRIRGVSVGRLGMGLGLGTEGRVVD